MDDTPLFIGHPIYHYEQLESTNSSALELIAKSSPSEGTAIMAGYQQLGRGQYGRKWLSPKGLNLLCSIILYPRFLKHKNQFLLNVFSSLAIRKLIADHDLTDVSIKWPNDIYVGDKKICGILIQNTIQSHFLKHSILGIGLNVNQNEFDPNLPNPTSLLIEKNKSINLNPLSENLFKYLEEYYLRLKAGKLDELKNDYISHLYKKGVSSSFKIDGKKVNGIITGIDLNGHITVDINGQMHAFNQNEIKYL